MKDRSMNANQETTPSPATSKTTKVIERTVDPGKWRIGTEPGAEVLRVWIKGMRDRPWELLKVSKEDFFSMVQKIPNGTAIDNALLRGLPSKFTTEGHIVLIWPAPNHQWKMQFEIRK